MLDSSIPYGQLQRLRFLESVTYWEGTLNRQRLCEAFKVTPNQVTKDMTFYKGQFPGNIDYDQSSRCYRPSKKFKPRIATGKPEEYLGLLRAHYEAGALQSLGLPSPTEADVVAMPAGSIEPAVLRSLTCAIAQKTGVRINYQSSKTPEPVERVVYPTALAFSGKRWHARAYDSLKKRYGDFVIARILEISTVQPAAAIEMGNDDEWNTRITIRVIPNPQLSEAQRNIVSKEYGMKKGPSGPEWAASMRRCMAPYFLRFHELREPNKKSLIVLANADDATKYDYSLSD